jgi:hypothetical protein
MLPNAKEDWVEMALLLQQHLNQHAAGSHLTVWNTDIFGACRPQQRKPTRKAVDNTAGLTVQRIS